jgi:hypothetical protein
MIGGSGWSASSAHCSSTPHHGEPNGDHSAFGALHGASHNAALREALSRGRAAMEDLAVALARLGPANHMAGIAVAACFEGLLLHRIARHDPTDPRPTFELVVRAALARPGIIRTPGKRGASLWAARCQRQAPGGRVAHIGTAPPGMGGAAQIPVLPGRHNASSSAGPVGAGPLGNSLPASFPQFAGSGERSRAPHPHAVARPRGRRECRKSVGTAADASASAGPSEGTSANGSDVSAGHGRVGITRLHLDERRVSYDQKVGASNPFGRAYRIGL